MFSKIKCNLCEVALDLHSDILKQNTTKYMMIKMFKDSMYRQ